MQRVGCVTSVWLIINVILKGLIAAPILLSSKVHDALTPYPFTFGDPALYATYLLGTAIFCLLILFGQEWALHLWAAVAIIAAAWDFIFRHNVAPYAPLVHLLGPTFVYILFSFGGGSRGTR